MSVTINLDARVKASAFTTVDVLGLEARLLRGETLDFSWREILRFAGEIHQMVDGRITARTSALRSTAVLTIEAIDSSQWLVSARAEDEQAIAAVRRVSALIRPLRGRPG